MGGKAADPNKAAMKQQEAQMERLDGLSMPELEEYILQNPELVGLLDAEQLGGSALEEISLDPKAREAQLAALDSLQDYSETGVTDTDKYAMEQMLGQVGASTKSNQANIEADMARRGMDSSGAALMSQMNAQQTGANNARQQAMQQAASGQQNRMAALGQLATQSGNMQNADYSRQANAASAKDAIAQANAANRYQTNAANLSARQSIENQRANTANQQSQVGNQIAQQNFNNEYARTGAQGNVANSMSNIAGNAQQGPSGLQAGLSGAATGAGIAASMGPAGVAAAPYAAAGGAALGLLGAMEDGGIAKKYADGGVHSNFQDGIDSRRKEAAEKEEKQHDAFKKKYMKKVRNELMDDGERRDIPSAKLHAKDGAVVNKYAEGGLKFDMMQQEPRSVDDINTNLRPPTMMEAPSEERDTIAEAVYNTKLAPQEELSGKESGMDMQKTLGALSSLIGSGESAPKQRLELGSNAVANPENIMNPVGPQNFANPYGEMQFKDGGCASNKYENGGTMYASDGMGDIVNSGMESYAGDRVDAKINDGEMILNVPQQQRLMDIIKGEESVDNIGESDIVEGVPRDYRDSLHEEKSEGSLDGTKLRGLEQLLKMLGEQ